MMHEILCHGILPLNAALRNHSQKFPFYLIEQCHSKG